MKLSAAALALLIASSSPSALAFTSIRAKSSYSTTSTAFGVSSSPFSTPSITRRRKGASGQRWQQRREDAVGPQHMVSSVDEEMPFISARSVASRISSDLIQEGVRREIATEIATRSSAAAYLSRFVGQTGAHIIYSKLQEYGTTVVNGYSGGAVLPLLDQFHYDHPRHMMEGAPKPIRWITNSNESSAGHVAEGYAKSAPLHTDQKGSNLPVGVVVATSGPGVTNLITPLQDAICDGVPLVVLCGQAATTAPPDAFQSAPAVDMTTPCTKWSYQIKSAAELPFVMDYAFYVARNGRPGPVFVDLPKDLQIETVTDELIEEFVESIPHDLSEEEEHDADLLAKIVPRRRPNGDTFSAIRLGWNDRGLAFEVTENAGELKLEAVSDATTAFDSHHADHHPTNTIHQRKTEVIEHSYNGSDDKLYSSSRTGDLGSADPVMAEMMENIKLAKKPIIIAGQGCNDCPDDLKRFAEMLQIPVTTTLHALGSFDERHPLALNMMGMHGHPTPNFMVQEADLVICIGSRFDDRITGRISDFIPEARKAAKEGRGGIIHVDIRLSENARQVEPTFFVHSTGKTFLRTMNEYFDKAGYLSSLPKSGDWIKRKYEMEHKYFVPIPHFPTEKVLVETAQGETVELPRTKMSAQSVVKEMDRQILAAGRMDDCIFSTGVGIHQMVAAQLITWTKPRQMLSSGSLGTMGVALGYAIGGKLANGKKIVIAVDGDGSFNMTFTELKSVAEQGIPVKILLLDNEAQMMVEYWQKLFMEKRYLAVRNEKNPVYTKLADAFGIKSLYCDAQEDLEEKMREFLFDDPDKPVLFHVRIERTPCLPMVAPGQPLDNMILEDLDLQMDAAQAPS